jgi:hypothetical protein
VATQYCNHHKFHQSISAQIAKEQDAPRANLAASSSSSDDEFLPAKVSVASFQILSAPALEPRTSPVAQPKPKPSKRSPLFNVVESSSRASATASTRRSRADTATELLQRSFTAVASSDSSDELPGYEAPVPDRLSADTPDSGRPSRRTAARKSAKRWHSPSHDDDSL